MKVDFGKHEEGATRFGAPQLVATDGVAVESIAVYTARCDLQPYTRAAGQGFEITLYADPCGGGCEAIFITGNILAAICWLRDGAHISLPSFLPAYEIMEWNDCAFRYIWNDRNVEKMPNGRTPSA